MKVALIGYGKMGKEIESICLSQGHQVPLIIDISNPEDKQPDRLGAVDVAIEFSSPESVEENILACFAAKIPVVVGTTGWNHREKEIKDVCIKQKAGLFYASNFSVGVNLFWAANQYLAKLIGKHSEYKAFIHEIHHTQKKDAPSGTAITTAQGVLDNSPLTMGEWVKVEERVGNGEGQLLVSSERKGDVVGFHEVTWDSEIDSISLSHNAKSRKGFALGAVLAAEYMKGKVGIYGMSDLLKL